MRGGFRAGGTQWRRPRTGAAAPKGSKGLRRARGNVERKLALHLHSTGRRGRGEDGGYRLCLQREEVMLVALQDGDLAVGRVLVTVEVVDAVLEEAHG